MRVEDVRGRMGTVLDASGYTKNQRWMDASTLYTVDGKPVLVHGQPGGNGIVVLWDRPAHLGGPLWGEVMRTRDLFPLGTYRAMRAAEDAAWEAEKAEHAAWVAEKIAQVRAAWGDKADWLLEKSLIDPTTTRLTGDQSRAIDLILLCGEAHNA